MFKSNERTVEYCVITRPWYGEHPPICYKGYAKDEEEAANVIFRSGRYKEILDVKKSNEIQWDCETIKRYWNMYGEYDEKYLHENNIKPF